MTNKKMYLKAKIVDGPRGRKNALLPNCEGSQKLFAVMVKPLKFIEDLVEPEDIHILGEFCKHYDIDLHVTDGETKPLSNTLTELGIRHEMCTKSGNLKLIY